MYSKIGTLNRAIEKAERHRINGGVPVEIAVQVREQAQRLEQHLVRLIEKTAAEKSSGMHGTKGLPVVLNKLKVETADTITSMNQTGVFAEKIKSYEADLINRAFKIREANKPKDAVLDYLETSEMRSWLRQTRQDAFQTHEALNTKKPFTDPVEALFNECCTSYDASKEQLLRAIIEAPYPISILSADKIAEGTATLERSLSPEIATALDYQKAMAAMYSEIYQAALDIIEQPDRQSIVQPGPYDRRLAADEPLQPLTVV